MSKQAFPWVLRADLVHRQIVSGESYLWVIKDPLARELVYFNDDEYRVLQLADGTRSLSQIVSECNRKFSPRFVAAESIVQFYASVRAKNLLDAKGIALANPCPPQPSYRWYCNPLAIRFPGFSPEPVLNLLAPVARRLLTLSAGLVAALLVIAAAALVIVHWSRLVKELATVTTDVTTTGVTALVIVLAFTKLVHELAHANVCRWFGGEVREMGVMVLLGIPCLYCDVSDAWLFRHRYERILVSAAGVIAELVLASLATFIWLSTSASSMHSLALIVMVVCSVSTVLVNANPLLRYDGYYVLSDLVGIPNLAQRSTEVVAMSFRRILWGLPKLDHGFTTVSPTRTALLASYSVASYLYRVAVLAMIGLVAYRFAEHHHLASLASLVLIALAVMVVTRLLRMILTPPDRSVRRASLTPRRPAVVSIVAVIVVLISCLIPLPRRVVAPLTLQPADAAFVFVPKGGTLVESISSGEDVRTGDTLARIVDPTVERELLGLHYEQELLETRLVSLQNSRQVSADSTRLIASVEKLLEDAQTRLRLIQIDADRQTIRSPRNGRVFAPPVLPKTTITIASFHDRDPVSWSGTPLDAANLGARLDAGTLLCVVGDAAKREAIFIVRQQDIDLVRQCQQVTILWPALPSGSLSGEVIEVASSASTSAPDELVAKVGQPPFYQVRVRLNDSKTSLPSRLTGNASIRVEPASILARTARLIGDAF